MSQIVSIRRKKRVFELRRRDKPITELELNAIGRSVNRFSLLQSRTLWTHRRVQCHIQDFIYRFLFHQNLVSELADKETNNKYTNEQIQTRIP